jgi:ParB family chromosome partitioning protein
MNDKSLGRGLSAFLNTQVEANEEASSVIKIDINNICQNPYQPRQTFDEDALNSLAESIKRNGILQPILVVKVDDNNYQLVAGERRLRASKIAGLTEIPALVTELGKEEQLEIAILENIQRENLNPIEEAEAYKRLIDEFHHTQEALSAILGKSRSHIANILRLLSLPNDVKQLVKDGNISFGHARTLIGNAEASDIAKQIISKNMSVRDIEQMLRQKRNNSDESYKYEDPEISNMAFQIASLTNLKTQIKMRRHGGTLLIDFNNIEELDKFMRMINPSNVI